MRMRAITLAICALLPAVALAGPGDKIADEYRERNTLLESGPLVDYVRAIGARLVAVSETPGAEFRFFVIDEDEVNAFAVPDGSIFVARGLMAHMENEAQLAAVIGHEIGHVTGGHASSRNNRQRIGTALGFVAAFMVGRPELIDVGRAQGATWATGKGRDNELDADRRGATYLARAGYDPLAMVDVVQVLKDRADFSRRVSPGAQNYHGLFATHPKNDRRLHEVVGQAEAHITETYVEPVGDYLELIDGLAYGDDVLDGVVRDNVFYHTPLSIVVTFPDDWEINNGRRRVTSNPPNGAPAEIVLEAAVLEERRRQPEPREYLEDFLGEKLVSGSALQFKEEDVQGFIGELAPEEDGSRVRLAGVVYRGGTAYLFRGELLPDVVDEEDAETDPKEQQVAQQTEAELREGFQRAVATLRGMERKDLDQAVTQRVEVIEAKPGDTYEKLGRESSLKANAVDTLRLLNGDYPNGQPRAGDRIKVVNEVSPGATGDEDNVTQLESVGDHAGG